MVTTDSIELYLGDCLEIMQKIPDESVDLILCDPPYGNIKTGLGSGTGVAAKKGYRKTEWDNPLSPEDIFQAAGRILRPNGKLILFAQEPYTSQRIAQQIPKLPFSQRAIWLKDMFANALGVNKTLACFFEDILIFNKIHPKHDYGGGNPLRQYFIQERDKTGLIDRMNSQFPNVFNLPEGEKYKANVFAYKRDKEKFHPTQKPIGLLEDLIATYTNPGMCVLDNCMGSGSTGVACVRTGRRFIGIEKDPQYFQIAQDRLEAEADACGFLPL